MQGNNEVRFELPDYVNAVDESFDGSEVTVEYDSNYNGRGETVTVSGTAELVGVGDYYTNTALVVDGRHVQSNGHVFNSDGRRLGRVESVTVTVDEQTAIGLVTKHVNYDVDRGNGEIIVQTWDASVIEQDGFMAGTDEVRMERVC